MAALTEAAEVVSSVKDAWGLSALAFIGITAIFWRHFKTLLRFIGRDSIVEEATLERRKTTAELIATFERRITALETDENECLQRVGALRSSVEASRIHSAQCEIELRIIKADNQELRARLNAFSSTLNRLQDGAVQ